MGFVSALIGLGAMPAAQAAPDPGADPVTKQDRAAKRYGLTKSELRTALREDDTLKVSPGGALYYVDPAPEHTATQAKVAQAAFPLADTFALHSKPGSTRTIYLDFDGHTVSGTDWNGSVAGVTADGAQPAWDPEANGAAFSNNERTMVQDIFQRVAEDYAPFDVDVTTEDPGDAAIDRSGAGDLAFGTRALITPSATALNDLCGGTCVGVAFLGAFDTFVGDGGSATTHADLQPAWIFPQDYGTDTKGIAETISHEVGHNFLLEHDGTSTVDYYAGHGFWAPIMGNSDLVPVTQFARNDYTDGTLGGTAGSTVQGDADDLAVIGANGAPTRADEAGATTAGAGPLPTAPAFISSRADKDVYALGSCSGNVTVSAAPADVSPNLDIELRLLDATGALVASADPAAAQVDRDRASGLDASITRSLTAGSYFVQVDGVGAGDPITSYDDFGSVGAYTLQSSGCAAAPPVSSSDLATTLIIDSSGSMGSEDPNDLRKDASRAYLTAAPGTEVGVVDFDSSATVLSDPVPVDSNLAALEAAIAQIDSSGGTNLGAGLSAGCASLDKATATKRGAIFLTDGDGSYNNEAQCFADKGWPVYTIGLGGGVDDTLLQQIAAQTQGRYLALTDATNIVCEFTQIRAELSGTTGSGCGNTGTVTNGQTVSQPLQIGANTGQATVTLSFANSQPKSAPGRAMAAPDGTDLRMTLVSPNGTEYKRDTVSPDFKASIGNTFETFTITNPVAGAWQVKVFGLNVPGSAAAFNVSNLLLPGNNPPPPPPPPPPVTPDPVVPTAVVAPRVGGVPRVGQTLTASDGEWNFPSGLSFSRQWLRDGAPIPGATGPTYVPGAGDLGKRLSVRVTASGAGVPNGTSTSDPVTVGLGLPAQATTPPGFTGDARVGETLTASDGVWDRPGVTLKRQWLRNGLPIAGQTGPTYTLTADDFGKNISLRVTASQAAYEDGVAESGFTPVGSGEAVTNTALPTVSGGSTWGAVLTAAPGQWSVPGVELAYQWLRDGERIPGQDESSYTLGTADMGHDISVRVIASHDQHESGQATSAPVRAVKFVPEMTAEPVDDRIRRSQRARVEVSVLGEQFAPTGLVRVEEDGKRVGSRTLANAEDGTIVIRLRKLGVGTHVLDVVYVGDGRTADATEQVTVKVVKRKKRR